MDGGQKVGGQMDGGQVLSVDFRVDDSFRGNKKWVLLTDAQIKTSKNARRRH